METNKKNEKLNKLDSFLDQNPESCDINDKECQERMAKTQNEIVERVNKKLITSDGRQLLNEYR
jgi:hypothetical protein